MSAPPMDDTLVLLDGLRLDTDTVVRIADTAARPVLDPDALARVEDARHAAHTLTATGRVYGRTTGVGANRSVGVAPEQSPFHDLRLLRSHAGGIGAPLDAREVRAMLAVRVNQVLAAGSGLRPALVQALADALTAGVHPVVNEFGAVGTGDLTALAQTGLALIGEHPWQGGAAPAPLALEQGDALALMSSNALTLGRAALVGHDLDRLVRTSQVVTALSLAAAEGSLEAYAAPVHAARPHPGVVQVAAEIRRQLGAPERPGRPAGLIQHPYGFRCFPQVHGPALEAVVSLLRVLAVDINAAAENPLISALGPGEGPAAYHHGGFFAAPLGLALDHLCLAVLGTARLSVARLSGLGDPAITGLPRFLAADPAADSGTMILEYSANSALAELRAAASSPASSGHTVLSRGVEEAASFASQAVRQTRRAAEAYRLVLACELVVAVRALRLRPAPPDPALPVGRAFRLADAALDVELGDRPLTGDVGTAAELLDSLEELSPPAPGFCV